MPRVLVTLAALLAAGMATAAPVPKAIKKPKEDRPFLEVMNDVERHTKLLYLSILSPDVTLKWPRDEDLTTDALLFKLNEQLEPHGYRLRRKNLSFCTEVLK